MVRSASRWALVLLAATTISSLSARAEPTAAAATLAHPPVITHHFGTFNGKKVRYTASVEGIDVLDTNGRPAARLVSFTYLADKVNNRARRPVMFVFNGGPITASLWLHIGVMGPKRMAIPDDLNADPAKFQLVDNQYALLDVAEWGSGFDGTRTKRTPAIADIIAGGISVEWPRIRVLRRGDAASDVEFTSFAARASIVAAFGSHAPEPITANRSLPSEAAMLTHLHVTNSTFTSEARFILALPIRPSRRHHMVATEAGVGVPAYRWPVTLSSSSVELAGG